MNWKQAFLMGVAGSLLSSLASIVYLNIYNEALLVDFSKIAGTTNVMAACTIGCLLITLCYKLVIQWKGIKTIGWLNIFFGVISFASIISVLGFSLPLDTESPELFPGRIISRHGYTHALLPTFINFNNFSVL